MASSSDEETISFHRKSVGKIVFDSDDEETTQLEGGTDDFVLRMSDNEKDDNTDVPVEPSQNIFPNGINDSNEHKESVASEGNPSCPESMLDNSGSNSTDHQKKRKSRIIAANVSDDDSLDTIKSSVVGQEEQEIVVPSKFDVLKKQTKALNHDEETNSNLSVVTQDIMKKLAALGDSESDVDGDLQSESDADIPVKTTVKKSKKTKTTSNSKSKIKTHPNFSSDLYDAEGSSDDEINHSSKSTATAKTRPERKSKTAAKDAMLEIKAESQRMLRQSAIGLPYHMPKQRSLADFLNRRRSSSMPIKGPSEKLVEVWKQIEEREKQAEDFFKSESEDEVASSEENLNNLSEKKEETSEEASQVLVTMCPDKLDIEKISVEDKVMESQSSFVPGKNSDSCELHSADVDVPALPVLCDTNNTNIECSSSEDNSQDIILRLSEMQHSNVSTKTNMKFRESSESSMMSSERSDFDHDQDQNIILKATDTCTVSSSEIVNVDSLAESSENFELKLSDTENTDVNKNNDPNDESDTNSHTDNDSKKCKDGNGRRTDEMTYDEVRRALESMSSDDDDVTENTDQRETEQIIENASVSSALPPTPQLSLRGNPEDLIDLDDVKPKLSHTPGVQSLIQRFLSHSGKKKLSSPQTVEMSLVSSERDKEGSIVGIKHESLTVVLSGEDETDSEQHKPGARLKLLKEDLYLKMKKQREEEWQRKQEAMKDEQSFDGEKEDCGMEDDMEDEEEDVTTESEPEIDDVREPRKKKKVKSAFVDEEAEDEDENQDDEDDENEEENENEDNTDEDENENENQDEECENEEKSRRRENKKADDLNHEDENSDNIRAQENSYCANKSVVAESVLDKGIEKCEPSGRLKRSLTSADLFASQDSLSRSFSNHWHEDDDDLIPAAQPNGGRHCNGTQNKSDDQESSFKFSPLTLTLSEKKMSSMSDGEVTPLKFNSFSSLGKNRQGVSKLFSESEPSTQENMDELLGLCSGKFTGTYNPVGGISRLAETQSTQSDNDLIALCSGEFLSQQLQGGDNALFPDSQITSQSQVALSLDSLATTVATGDSQDFSLKWNDHPGLKSKESIENADNVYSKKKFEMEVMSSDEEDEVIVKEKKIKSKKLDFSDDEEEKGSQDSRSDTDDQDDNESTQFKLIDAQLDEDTVEGSAREIMYDSDENEIRPEAFFENEAELSEEEWDGSEDEDEKGLDQVEMEEADKEDIDQNMVREDIIKSHMKNMLDEDRRDVRILQEMLLEDGELHSEGGGRERQFRWKNVDSTGMADDLKNSDEENAEGEDEEEEDAEWRRQRYEREMFLKEQRMKQAKESGVQDIVEDELLENSELLQLGKAVLHKSRSSSMDMTAPKEPLVPKPSLPNPLVSPDAKRPYQIFAKRGSFLARSEGVLAKLAQLTGSTKENVSSGAKNSRKFVFTAVSPTKTEEHAAEEDHEHKVVKRKASHGLSNPKGKMVCLSGSVKKGGLFDHL